MKERESIALKNAFQDGLTALNQYLAQNTNIEQVEELARMCAAALKNGNKVLICGNGGSCADAMHFAEELTGRYRQDRPALPALALADPTHITCVGNDYGFDRIFARGVEAHGKKGDVFIALSTSGNSANIVLALQEAKARGLNTVTLLGKTGGKCRELADLTIIVPGATSDRIQELHMMILHIAIEGIERLLFPEYTPDVGINAI